MLITILVRVSTMQVNTGRTPDQHLGVISLFDSRAECILFDFVKIPQPLYRSGAEFILPATE